MLKSRALSAGLTDIGKFRTVNEDHFLVADLNRSMTIHSSTLPVEEETEFYSGISGQLLLVADGVSGAPGGGVASQIGVGTVARYVLNTMPWFFSLDHEFDADQDAEQTQELLAAMLAVERAIEAEGERSPEFAGMGTTLTMAYVIWPRVYVVHIGDSRCYLWRRGRLEQLTHDQTAAQDLVDHGTLTPEQAARSPLSKVLISSIGQGMSSLRPDIYKTDLEPGDRLLVCTDGLTAQVDDTTIAVLMGSRESPEAICRSLVDAANRAGGTDNVTVVVSILYPPIDLPTR